MATTVRWLGLNKPVANLKLIREPGINPGQRLELSDEQRSVVAHRGSPLLVLGGPGTGKSVLMVERALSYIEEGIDPNQILLLTFDRERATELNDSIVAHIPKSINGAIVKTIPALAFGLLRAHAAQNGKKPPTLLSGAEQEFYIRELLGPSAISNLAGWPEELLAAVKTAAFAREMRDLIMRATERGIRPEALAQLSKSENFPIWLPASKFYLEYTHSRTIDEDYKLDPSELIINATNLIARDEQLHQELRNKYKVVLVDEYQESDPAHRELIKLISAQELTLFADPDLAVGRFRGADPEGVSRAADSFADSNGNPAEILYLLKNYRSSLELNNLTVSIAKGFRYSRITEHRERVCEVEQSKKSAQSGDNKQKNMQENGEILTARLETAHEEARFIAHHFHSLHLGEGIPYNKMAIILRSPGARTATLRRTLGALGIPVSQDSNSIPLILQSAISPMILIARISLAHSDERRREILTPENVESLLLSPFAGGDPLTLRRMRYTLLKMRDVDSPGTNETNETQQNTHEILRDLLLTPMADFDWNEFAAAKRISDLIAVAVKAANRKAAQSENVLWEIWDNAIADDGRKISQLWQSAAIEGDSSADSNLDAVLSLFEAAARHADRYPGASASAFIKQIESEVIEADTIATRAARTGVVEILTAHSAKGREWDVVAVAGVEEGRWPNLKARGSLLGSERLAEIARREVAAARSESEHLLGAASALLDDERRLFYNALTRARRYLLLTSTTNGDEQPSQFFAEVEDHLYPTGAPELKLPTYLPPALLVAKLRKIAEDSTTNPEDFAAAVTLLKTLDKAGISAANPQRWYGALPLSTDAPLVADGEPLKISPSSLETLRKCSLKWVLENHGGRDGDSNAQLLGSAFHELAARVINGANVNELTSELKILWSKLELGEGWSESKERDHAVEMLIKFTNWHQQRPTQLLAVEESFSFTLGRALIKGSVDRLELAVDGSLIIVDLKTAKNVLSIADGKKHAQLAAYQLAVAEGGFKNFPDKKTPGGALLYYVADGKKGADRKQAPINVENVRGEILRDSELMAAAKFIATENSLCRTCGVIASCPIKNEGRSLFS
ncbi:MAG: ATP-dependent helicase [Candidatus Nanopelagicaceae bacterium]|nr:ATP-dependent helicase [Candidatus Nanopelagicaceae bacterium]